MLSLVAFWQMSDYVTESGKKCLRSGSTVGSNGTAHEPTPSTERQARSL